MIFMHKENKDMFIASANKKLLLDLRANKLVKCQDKIEETYSSLERMHDVEGSFEYMLDSQIRVLRVIQFINDSMLRDVKIFGRVFNITGKTVPSKILKKEFYALSIDELDTAIGFIKDNVILEFIVLDESVDIQELLSYARQIKARCQIYTLFPYDDTAISTIESFNCVQRLKIPSYIEGFLR